MKKKKFKTIDDVICEYMDQKRKRVKKERGLSCWPASQLGKCKRHQFLNRTGIVTGGTSPYKWKNAAEDGHASHHWRQRAFKKMGVLVEEEGSVQDKELNYCGHFDAIIELEVGMVLLDIKTQNNRNYRARARMPEKAFDTHRRQLCSYFYFLKKHRYPDLKEARLYYVNKNTGERDELVMVFDDDEFEDLVKELRDLNCHWAEQTLPKRERTNFCHICAYSELCKAYGNVQGTLFIKDELPVGTLQELQTKKKSGSGSGKRRGPGRPRGRNAGTKRGRKR
jgi:CRISPR/Cas system-associated exonuclease Cas4 (RecB family)